MDEEQRKERRKEISKLAREVANDFRKMTGLLTLDEKPKGIKLHDLNNYELAVVVRSARQIRDLGIAAENLIAKRSAANRKQWQRQQNEKTFAVVRELSQTWIAEGVERSERLKRVAALGTVKA